MGFETFIVAGEERIDPIAWAEENPSLLGEGFRSLSRRVPLPGGDVIPLLGVEGGGAPAVVIAVENESEAFLRLGRAIAFLRERSEWLREAFPDRGLREGAPPRPFLIAAGFSPSFRETLGAVFGDRPVLLVLRALTGADGRRLLFLERAAGGDGGAPGRAQPGDLTAEERAFFRRLEEERDSLLHREGVG
ncbi:MAG: hypothetical protein JW958_05110 [Candidatus Eisenbacteria bacterium]|nr:hypothetical protein [Candidatus Eisenbacteria bacterium]